MLMSQYNELSSRSHTSDTETSRFDAPPEAALAAIHAHDGPLLIDLDETLYLRNSTEDFIDCARPALLALLLLRVFDVIKPWELTGGATRDNWRVCAIAILFPWTHLRWRAQARRLAECNTNQQLKDCYRGASSTAYHPDERLQVDRHSPAGRDGVRRHNDHRVAPVPFR